LRRSPDGRRPARAVLGFAAACAAVALAASVPHDEAAAAASATHEIVIQGLLYVPQTLTVKRGDVVVWVNKDPFPHTATSTGAFDSTSIAAGATWRFKATRSGSFAYLCTLHPTMKGTLRVE